MKNSIYFKNFISGALIVLMSFAMLGGLALTWNYRRTMADVQTDMSQALDMTARYFSAQSHTYTFEPGDLYLSMRLSVISGVSGFHILLTCVDGSVVSCSEQRLIHLGETIPQAEFAHTGEFRLTTLGYIYPEVRQVVSTPLVTIHGYQPVTFGYMFLSSDPAALRQEWRHFSAMFILFALCVLAFTFIISFLFTKKQAEPINEMAAAARRFARGDFEVRVKGDPRRTDEIGELTQAFNAMADSLENSEMLRSEFIANISHELKTPMTVIAGFADGILDGTIPPDQAERYLALISSETHRLSRLVKSMLEMSKLQTVDFAELLKNSFDLDEVVRLALLSLEGKIEAKGLSARVALPEERVEARGDQDAITQVLYNLIDNAIKFSTPGGTIVLELWKQGGRAYVSVENHGETIPPEELPHVFDRFHKTDKARSADRDGVGLGLYIVKRILDNHNEDIFVTSCDGVTKFVFSLHLAVKK